MILAKENINQLRSLSEVFTNSGFNKIIREEDCTVLNKKLKKYYQTEKKREINYKKVLTDLYASLEYEYRSEYFFKNTLFNKFLLKQYSLATTTVLNEFKIGNSIADFVLLNGTARVFEIKTDLDGLEKLGKQIDDYKQFADLVYIVTSSKHIEKVLTEYSATTIGVIELTQRGALNDRKKAESNCAYFNHLTLFKTLRKAEYLEIVEDYYGEVPNVPNTKIFRTCVDLISKIDVRIFQKSVFNKLKDRKIKCPELLESKKTPFELKHICYTLDFTKEEYSTLHTFLKQPI